MNFCTSCGNKLNDGQKFCPSCGKSVTEEISQEVQLKENNKVSYADDDDDDDVMKYRVFNYGKGTVSLPSRNPVDKIQEFQQYLKKAIAESDLDCVKSRSVLNLGPSKEISALETEFMVDTNIEQLIFFFDVSPHETRDYGIVLTSFGILYKFYGERKLMPWKELAEEYAIRADVGVEIVEPGSVMDEDADPIMDINPSQTDMAMLGNKWLFDIICKGCDIFAEMEDGSEKPDSKKPKGQSSKKVASFLKKNPEGIIMSIIVSVLIFMGSPSIIGFFLTPTLSFVGYIIGNKIRLAIHPDFVIASGFMGLLKEKFFWRFIPQLIGASIGAALGAFIGSSLF
jgi:uncharacterized Zn finger protein (UPF0148 family)